MFCLFRKRVYMDYAAATPVHEAAVRAMRDAERFIGNPGGIHAEGVAALASLERSRESIALNLQCKARELIFTSGLTESNNIAIVGTAKKIERMRRSLSGTHWIVSSIEHSSILSCFAEVERMGGAVAYVEPDTGGSITVENVMALLRPETVFVSIGWANNEIGVIQPIRDIARAVHARDRRILVHTDAGQAPLYLKSSVNTLAVDFMSLGSNKIYGPHGIGALFMKDKRRVASVLVGGGQESGLRPGTENVALAAGFASAFESIVREREAELRRLRSLRDALSKGIRTVSPDSIDNGDAQHVLPHMVNVSFPGIGGEYLTLALDAQGVAVSTKSACREGDASRSHVIDALEDEDAPVWRAHNTIRFSLGRQSTSRDVRKVVAVLHHILQSQRI